MRLSVVQPVVVFVEVLPTLVNILRMWLVCWVSGFFEHVERRVQESFEVWVASGFCYHIGADADFESVRVEPYLEGVIRPMVVLAQAYSIVGRVWRAGSRSGIDMCTNRQTGGKTAHRTAVSVGFPNFGTERLVADQD